MFPDIIERNGIFAGNYIAVQKGTVLVITIERMEQQVRLLFQEAVIADIPMPEFPGAFISQRRKDIK